ncbi:MAG: hypothetical protein ABL996_02050 [Micropepsaceae bacterium]
MAVRAESFDFLSNLDTLGAIIAGAVIATAAGFIASQIEHRVDAKRRERQAALFFGEIMALLGVTVGAATRARGIGDPFGPVTMRLLRMIRRELDIYDRNRERLFELRDPALRARIHVTLLRTTMGVEGALESAAEVSQIETELKINAAMPPEQRDHLVARMSDQGRLRDGGFQVLVEASEQAGKLIKTLEPIARVDFETLVKATRSA